MFDVGDRDLLVPISGNWVIKGCMTKWLRFYVFNFFLNPKTWLFTFFEMLHTFSRTLNRSSSARELNGLRNLLPKPSHARRDGQAEFGWLRTSTACRWFSACSRRMTVWQSLTLAAVVTSGAGATVAVAGSAGRAGGRRLDNDGWHGFVLDTAGGSLAVSNGATLPAHNVSKHCSFSLSFH